MPPHKFAFDRPAGETRSCLDPVSLCQSTLQITLGHGALGIVVGAKVHRVRCLSSIISCCTVAGSSSRPSRPRTGGPCTRAARSRSRAAVSRREKCLWLPVCVYIGAFLVVCSPNVARFLRWLLHAQFGLCPRDCSCFFISI